MIATVNIYDTINEKRIQLTVDFKHLPRVGDFLFYNDIKVRVREVIHFIEKKGYHIGKAADQAYIEILTQ